MGHIRYKLNQPRRKKYPLILQFFIDYTNLDPNEMKTSPIDGRIILAFLDKEGWVVGRVNKRKGVIDIGESNKQLEELVAWNDLEIKKAAQIKDALNKAEKEDDPEIRLQIFLEVSERARYEDVRNMMENDPRYNTEEEIIFLQEILSEFNKLKTLKTLRD